MSDLSDLYQEMILDHGKRPRNLRELEGATGVAEGFNPLCGDRVKVFVRATDSSVEEMSFTGSGCAICMASASMMTQRLSGANRAEAAAIFECFTRTLREGPDERTEEDLGSLAVLSGVQKYPMRVKCATLPWHTMREALDGAGNEVSTE